MKNDVEREEEAPSHKTRRRIKQRLDEVLESFDPDAEYDDIEREEPIKRKGSR